MTDEKNSKREQPRDTQGDMIDIHIKADGDRNALAQMIASTHGEDVRDPAVAQVATLVREQQEENERTRPSRNELQTVDFDKLDPDNDWSDV